MMRLLQKTDLLSFKNLRLEGLKETPKSYMHIYSEEVDKPDSYYENFIAFNKIVGTFDDNNELIAFAIMSLFGAIKQRHKCMIWGAYVKPEFRNKGLGKKMRLFLFDEARKANLTHCLSSIAADNPASLEMHKGVGYEVMYTEKNGLKHRDETFTDIIHLIKIL